MAEKVYMVWNYYDGVRTGIADFGERPHHFDCRFDEQIDDYSEFFDLKPMDAETLDLALEQWSILQSWEAKRRSGVEPLETYPGYGGRNKRYDELETELKRRIAATPTTDTVRAEFKLKDGQPARPESWHNGVEVVWL